MKKMIIALACSTFAYLLQAQNDASMIGLSYGIAAPLGDFASTDGSNSRADFASLGTSIDLNFGIKLGENLGIAALVRRQTNSFNENAYLNEFIELVPNAFWSIESENYRMIAFMAGLYGNFPIDDQWSFETRTLGGIAITNYPKLDLMGTGDGASAIISQTAENSNAFSFNIGASLSYAVSEKVFLMLSIDYWSTTPEFDVLLTSTVTEPMRVAAKVDVQSFNTSLGIGFRL